MNTWRKIFSSIFDDKFKPFEMENKVKIPNRAKFTGDKITKSGDPAKIELNAWHSGASKFMKYKERENKDQFTSLVVNVNGRAEGEGIKGVGSLRVINPQTGSTANWRSLFKISEVSFNQKSDGTVSIDVTTPEQPLPKADEEVQEMKEEEQEPGGQQINSTIKSSNIKESWRSLFKISEVSFNQKPDGTVTIDVTNPPIPETSQQQIPIPQQLPVEDQGLDNLKQNQKPQKKVKSSSLLDRIKGRVKGLKRKQQINKESWQVSEELSLDDLNVGDKVKVNPAKLNEILSEDFFNQHVDFDAPGIYIDYDTNPYIDIESTELQKSLYNFYKNCITNMIGIVQRKGFDTNEVYISYRQDDDECTVNIQPQYLEKVSEEAENPDLEVDNSSEPETLPPSEGATKQWIIKQAHNYALVGRECKDRCGIFIIPYSNTLTKSSALQNIPEKAFEKEIQEKNNHNWNEIINQGKWETKFDSFVNQKTQA